MSSAAGETRSLVTELVGSGTAPLACPRGRDGHLHLRDGRTTPLRRLHVGGLFALFAVYASLVVLVSHGAEADWGVWAAVTYAAAGLLATVCWRRAPAVPLVVALGGALVAPAASLPSDSGPTSEVHVVARAASLWLSHGTPYLVSNQLVSWRSYDPYLPGMSLFGLPHALGLPGPLGDPLGWLALTTVVALVAAFLIAAPEPARRCPRCRRQILLRAFFLLATPVFAFPMSLGVTDPPVIALMCLAMAFCVRGGASQTRDLSSHESHHDGAQPEVGPTRTHALWPAPDESHFDRHLHTQLVLAGFVIGVACALKATAWPALPVVLALVLVRDGWRAAVHFTVSALLAFGALTALCAPKLLAQPKALLQNLVEYPLGLSHRVTPAASPLPGHVLAGAGTLGHLAAIGLLAAAIIAVGLSLVVRPPTDVVQTTIRLAIGLTAMFLLAPDTRFGYFAYPVAIMGWLLLAVPFLWRTRSRRGSWGTRARQRELSHSVAAKWTVVSDRRSVPHL